VSNGKHPLSSWHVHFSC